MKFLSLLIVSMLVTASGCAINNVYDPLQAAGTQTFLLNESALKKVDIGMTQTDVHNLLGQEIIIGYAYQNPSSEEAPRLAPVSGSEEYKPLTIANPYKQETLTTPQGACTIEYYVTTIQQPDGVITDNELMPLVFCSGVLTAKGWERVKSLKAAP